MAALNFPSSPTDGQLYPDPAIPGSQQYIYRAAKGTWQTVAQGVAQVYGQTPIVIKGTQQDPVVSINQASNTQAGYITPADYAKIGSIPEVPGTVTEVIAGIGLDVSPALEELGAPNSITTRGTLNVIPATRSTLGGVIPGAGLSINPDGRIDVSGASNIYDVLDNLAGQFNGSQTSFDITSSGIQIFPADADRIWIFLGGIYQTPGTAFTLIPGQSTITFSEPPALGTTFFGYVFS